MAFKLVDRVRETTVSPGTGTATLAGAATGYQSFSAGVGANNTTYYVIADQSGGNWEVGYGTVGAGGTTLARTTVLSSSNAGSLVNFASGTQDVWVDYPATKAINLDSNGKLSFGGSNLGYADWASAAPTVAAGRMWYDGTTGSWNLGMGGGNITQQVGEELFVYGKASAAITDSPLQIIYQTGVVGASGVITFAPTVAGITDGDLIVGVATESIALNGFGRVNAFGIVHGITTDGTAYGETWANGDTIWYNPVTGNPTKVKPVAPNIKVQIGVVINAGSGGSGSFSVEIAHGSVLGGTDSNVQLTSPTGGQILTYNQTGAYWSNVSLGAGTGFSATAGAGGSLSIGASVAAIGTWMATPSSANLLAAMTDETGTGSLVFANTPTLVTPNIGAATGTSLSVTGSLTSTVATGTAPLAVTSTTLVSNLNVDLLDGQHGSYYTTAGNLTGTIPSAVLGNSTLYVGTTAIALNRTSANLALTGLLSGTFQGSTSGSVQLIPAAVAGTGTVLTMPATTGTIITSGDTGTVTNTMLAGSIANAKLLNSSVTINGSAVSLGGSITVTATATNALTIGTGLSGTSYNGSTAVTIANSGVLSFSGGTTGLTPNTATTGAITLAGTLAIANGGTGATSAPAAFAGLNGFTTTATAAGSTTLTNTSNVYQIFTGTTTQTIVLPVTTTLTQGWTFHIVNASTGNLTVNSSGGNLVITVLPNTTAMVTCILASGTTAASWEAGLTDLSAASSTQSGYLTSTDWTTFNNKGSGSVTSVSGTGTVSGLTLTGTVTTSGSLTLGGTLAVTPSNFSSQTANTFLAAPNGTAGVPTFRAIVAADVPTLNQNTTGTAANVTGVVAAANGGTGQSSYTIGDLLYASGATALSKLADVATGNALISGGVGVAPSWGKIGLTTHISGTLAVGNGGTGLTTLTAGYIPFGAGTSAFGSSANLFWDSTNNRLGIGTVTPGANLEVAGSSDFTTVVVNGFGVRIRTPSGSASAAVLQFTNNPVTSQWARISSAASNTLSFDDSAGTSRMQMDAGGRFITPSQTAFLCDKSNGDVSAPNNIVFNNVSLNVGSGYNSSTGVFTAPVAGRYFFYAAALNVSSNVEIRFLVNGGFAAGGRNSGSAYAETSYSTLIIQLAASDQVVVNVTTGTVYGGGGFTQFNGYLLG